MMNTINPIIGFTGTVKVEYPDVWTPEVVDRLERSPRWKKYYLRAKEGGDLRSGEILFQWSCEFDCFTSLLESIRQGDFVDTDLKDAIRGLEYGTENLKKDLSDIIEFMYATDSLPKAPEQKAKKSPALAKVG